MRTFEHTLNHKTDVGEFLRKRYGKNGVDVRYRRWRDLRNMWTPVSLSSSGKIKPHTGRTLILNVRIVYGQYKKYIKVNKEYYGYPYNIDLKQITSVMVHGHAQPRVMAGTKRIRKNTSQTLDKFLIYSESKAKNNLAHAK